MRININQYFLNLYIFILLCETIQDVNCIFMDIERFCMDTFSICEACEHIYAFPVKQNFWIYLVDVHPVCFSFPLDSHPLHFQT
jgi:hypothetical protein